MRYVISELPKWQLIGMGQRTAAHYAATLLAQTRFLLLSTPEDLPQILDKP